MQERLTESAADLKPVDYRVVLAVVSLLTSWSKVEDEVYRVEVADRAGCNEQTAGKSLTRLNRLGVLGWVPTKRQKSRSWVGLAPRHETTVISSALEHKIAVISSHETASVSHPSIDPENGGTPLPPTDHELWSRSLIAEHWGHIGQPRQNDVATLIGLLGAGWAREQVAEIVTSNVRDVVDPARTMTALTKRLDRLRHRPSHEAAMQDGDLLARLGRRRWSPHAPRTSSGAGGPGDWGGVSGRIDDWGDSWEVGK